MRMRGVPYKAHHPPSVWSMWDLTIYPLKGSDVLVGTLAPHGRVALIPNCHAPDRLYRSTILSALGLATFSPARTVLFLGAHEATSQGGHPSWDCSSLQLA
ncbi:hypothetical protein L3X38_031901 [Prunus dulcis]|uniref:Uncharacterized protein n=1 Tax=Prunus dulcis TaxID=3755 RepID=A0AAD4VCZ7_PRUDU|nr:hypothetical protein L3X38_031901 [Prunus dulcis]